MPKARPLTQPPITGSLEGGASRAGGHRPRGWYSDVVPKLGGMSSCGPRRESDRCFSIAATTVPTVLCCLTIHEIIAGNLALGDFTQVHRWKTRRFIDFRPGRLENCPAHPLGAGSAGGRPAAQPTGRWLRSPRLPSTPAAKISLGELICW